MIGVTVNIKERFVVRRVRVIAASIRRALELAGDGKPGKEVRVVFPIDPEAFFAGEGIAEALEELAIREAAPLSEAA